MAYDETLGRRIAALLERDGIGFTEKKMFGGLGFMINDKMCVGVIKDELMVRVMDDEFERVLELPHARPMDFTVRPMRGFVIVGANGIKDDTALRSWIARGLEFAERGVVKSKKKKQAG